MTPPSGNFWEFVFFYWYHILFIFSFLLHLPRSQNIIFLLILFPQSINFCTTSSLNHTYSITLQRPGNLTRLSVPACSLPIVRWAQRLLMAASLLSETMEDCWASLQTRSARCKLSPKTVQVGVYSNLFCSRCKKSLVCTRIVRDLRIKKKTQVDSDFPLTLLTFILLLLFSE